MRLVLALALSLAACNPSFCNGVSCDCPDRTSCTFDACNSTTQSCSLNCQAGSTCAGSCGAECRVQCSGERCTHAVGPNSRVVCSSGACDITCHGACTVAGSANITCAGGSARGLTGCD